MYPRRRRRTISCGLSCGGIDMLVCDYSVDNSSLRTGWNERAMMGTITIAIILEGGGRDERKGTLLEQ